MDKENIKVSEDKKLTGRFDYNLKELNKRKSDYVIRLLSLFTISTLIGLLFIYLGNKIDLPLFKEFMNFLLFIKNLMLTYLTVALLTKSMIEVKPMKLSHIFDPLFKENRYVLKSYITAILYSLGFISITAMPLIRLVAKNGDVGVDLYWVMYFLLMEMPKRTYFFLALPIVASIYAFLYYSLVIPIAIKYNDLKPSAHRRLSIKYMSKDRNSFRLAWVNIVHLLLATFLQAALFLIIDLPQDLLSNQQYSLSISSLKLVSLVRVLVLIISAVVGAFLLYNTTKKKLEILQDTEVDIEKIVKEEEKINDGIKEAVEKRREKSAAKRQAKLNKKKGIEDKKELDNKKDQS